MDFDLSEETKAVLDVARWVGARLADGYQARDRGDSSADDVIKALAEASLLGLSAPAEAQGQGSDFLTNGMVCETLAHYDWTAASLASGTPTWLRLIHDHGSPEVQDWLPDLAGGLRRLAFSITEEQSGSDTTNIRTTATRDGAEWVIRGEKNSTSWPTADAVVLLAKMEGEGSGVFLVPMSSPGITVSLLDDLGNRPVGRSIITYDNVRIPASYQLGEPGTGLRAIMANFTTQKVFVGLMAIGAAQACIDEAVDWAKNRVTFGAPLSTRQGVAYPLVEGIAKLEMARQLCYKALWLADQGLPHRQEAAMVKAMVPRLAVGLCHDAMIVVGHTAYSKEHVMQLRLRDAISAELAEGPENIQKNLIAREVFGVRPG